MAGIAQGEPYFRKWITMKLAAVRQTLPKASDEELAEWLGVTVQVLRDSREIAKGHRKIGGYTFGKPEMVTWRIKLPEAVGQIFSELSEARDMPTGTLLRSLIHWVLTEHQLPMTPNYYGGSGWTVFGQVYRVRKKATKSGKAKSRIDVGAYVTRGAQEALNIRANMLQSIASALVRGALIDLVEGRVGRLEIMPNASHMLDRAEDYFKYWRESEIRTDESSAE